MPETPLKPLTNLLAETAVDDALAKTEKYPNMKRARLNRDAARRFLDEDASEVKENDEP
ncbi:MAG: hypothetical protein IID48_11950 [Proteobacteria bacterium]|nr:hypothetical protein [Pseudomonadota bacterium]